MGLDKGKISDAWFLSDIRARILWVVLELLNEKLNREYIANELLKIAETLYVDSQVLPIEDDK